MRRTLFNAFWVIAMLPMAQSLTAGSVNSTGLKPLTELSPNAYNGFPGGLYPGESNTIPTGHRNAGLAQAALVMPRDATGDPNPDGWIVMISVGMSNTTHEFGPFERQEDLNGNRNARLIIVNTAHGGQTASIIKNPTAPYWTMVNNRLTALHLTPQQVQVVWIKEANANPSNNFPIHAQELAADLRADVQVMRDRFPNLRLCYLSSRIYGGYATGNLNPEPQAYESGFSVKWLIEDQINGAADLNFDPANGPVEAPWLSWGPYLWADGVIPRSSDGLVWVLSDLETDRTHPASSGEQKVADMLSGFLASDPTSAPWYSPQPDVALQAVDVLEDAYVSLVQPTQNFGLSPTLNIAGGASATDVLLKFDVSGVTAPIFFAKLSLRVDSITGAPPARVKTVSDDAWTQATVTWSSAPAGDEPYIITTGGISRDGSSSADVTQAVTSATDGIVSLRLSWTGASAGAFLSRESGQPPRLILVVKNTAEATPAVSSFVLGCFSLAIAAAGIWLIRRRSPRRVSAWCDQ